MSDRAETVRRGRRPRATPLSVVGHEIRGPLGVVITLSEMLLARELGSSERELVALLRLAGNHVLGVAEDLCAQASLNGDRLHVASAGFDPAGTVVTLAALWAPIAAGADRRVEFHVADDVPAEIVSDEGRIRQVLFNLVSNATRHADGTITISVRRVRGRLAFEVADRGWPGPAAGSAQGEGLGIGLWISRRLAEALGGRLTLAQRRGGGTIARLTVPLSPPAPRSVRPASRKKATTPAPLGAPAERTSRRLHVLVVDDNTVSQMLMTAMLASFDMSVATVPGGREAAAAAAARRPDVVVTDWQLAGETGADAMARIAAVLGPAMPPVVLVSADATLPPVPGVAARVAKPFTPRELRAAIDRVLAPRAVASAG